MGELNTSEDRKNSDTPRNQARSERVKKEDAKGGQKSGLGFFTVLLISVFSSVVSLFIYHYFFALKVAVVDLSGYIIGLRNLYLAGKLDDNGLKMKLDEAINIIKSNENKYVILPAEGVLGRNKNVHVINLPSLPPEAQVSVEDLLRDYLKNRAGGNSTNLNLLKSR